MAPQRRRGLRHLVARQQRLHYGQSTEFHFERDQTKFKSPEFGESAAKPINPHNHRACGLFPQHITPGKCTNRFREDWFIPPSQRVPTCSSSFSGATARRWMISVEPSKDIQNGGFRKVGWRGLRIKGVGMLHANASWHEDA
jgi:hypothetical protein